MTSKALVERFWEVMGTNDFTAASQLLTQDYEGHWPQSGEIIRGRENFAAINAAYPAKGPWQFTIHRLVAEGDSVVSDVTVTDSDLVVTVVSFHTVRGEQIARQVEYWPEPYEAPTWRAKWVGAPDGGTP